MSRSLLSAMTRILPGSEQTHAPTANDPDPLGALMGQTVRTIERDQRQLGLST